MTVMRNFLVIPLLCAFLLPLSLSATETGQRKIRVLIVDGFSNHDWKLTTQLICAIIEPTGLFAVEVSTAPPATTSPGWDLWRPKFADYDVVIQNCNDINGGPAWPREVQIAFENFVRQGGGVYVWHSGNNAFADWPAYNEIIGLGWRKKEYGWALTLDDTGHITRIPPGEGQGTGHGKRFAALINRLGDHPIHEGLPRRWKAADIEVYYYVRGPAENIEILSSAFEPKTQMNWPIEWTVQYGQGRVYTSTLGHVWKGDVQPVTVRDAAVQTLLVRALQWLAKVPITLPAPADFPTENATSIRAELPLAGG